MPNVRMQILKKKKRKRIQTKRKWKRSEEFCCSSFIEYGKGFFYTFLIKELKKYRREFFSIHCFRYFAVDFSDWLIIFFFLISHKCTKRNSWTGTQEFQEAYIRFVEKNKGRRSIIDRIDAWEKVFVFRGRASSGRVVLEPARKRGCSLERRDSVSLSFSTWRKMAIQKSRQWEKDRERKKETNLKKERKKKWKTMSMTGQNLRGGITQT